MRSITAVFLLLLGPLAGAADVATLKADGLAALGEQRFKEAAALYRKVLDVAADDAEAHYRLGSALLSLEQDAAALAAFDKAVAGGFQVGPAHVRSAQLHARNHRADAVYSSLQASLDAGFSATGFIDGIAEFDRLRDTARFQEIYAGMRAIRYPCEADPRAHAFDFWIGEWDVYVGGQLVGSNHIYPILNHCALSENWTSVRGGVGKSYNYFDTGDGTWNQVWISDSGSFVEFSGEARDGGIFYTAETINPANGALTKHNFNFTVNDDGSVRQYWETSADGGETYTSIWDSRYVRKAAAKASPDGANP